MGGSMMWLPAVCRVKGHGERGGVSNFRRVVRRAVSGHCLLDLGQTFAMAGGSPMHSLIAANLIGELRNKLKGGPCKPFTSDLRLKVQPTGLPSDLFQRRLHDWR